MFSWDANILGVWQTKGNVLGKKEASKYCRVDTEDICLQFYLLFTWWSPGPCGHAVKVKVWNIFPPACVCRHPSQIYRSPLIKKLCTCMQLSQRPNSWTKASQKCIEFSSLLFTVTSTALPWDFSFFKLAQPLTVSIKEKGGKPNRKPHRLPYGLRNPGRNLKSENSQDYAQKPQWNCTFMNSASAKTLRLVSS
jgi:hypothetical protein